MIIKKRSEVIKEKDTQEDLAKGINLADNKINLLDLDNINFVQRQEKRRGDRRRGYRRIDDRSLISRAHEEASIIKENAAKEGYKEGLEKAKEDVQNFKTVLGVFLKAKEEVFEYIAPDILEISAYIAQKIVKHEIQQNPHLILKTILDVLKTISQEESRIIIKVNPKQMEIVKENIAEITASIGLDIKASVIADDTIEIEDCIIQTSNGVVDATLNTQLEIIKEAFKGI
jgi:flagellar assembly protein FliH